MDKVYEFRRLQTPDIFTMAKILSVIGVNKFADCFKTKEVQELVSSTKKDENREIIVGIGVVLEVVQVIFENLDKCEKEIYKLLADTSNLSIDEIKALDGVIFLEMLTDFFKKEEFIDFFKAASKLLSKEK